MKASFPNLLRCAFLLCLGCAFVPQQVMAQSTLYTYTNINGSITITKYIGPGGDASIPGEIDGLPVTGIGDEAFLGSTSLTSITMPDSVTGIGYDAFFLCTGLTAVIIPNSVTNIGYGVFTLCTGLTNVVIGSSVTSIGLRAFSGCASLNAITVDTNNSAYSSADGVLFNRTQTTLIQCPEGKAGNYTIPSSVTSIGYEAFSACMGLTSVIIPNSVTTIGGWAFYACKGLTSVIIPNSVTTIEESALFSCTSLTNVVIGSSVAGIGRSAFFECTNLTSVIIPNSVTSLGDYVFMACPGLTGAYFEGNVPSGGDKAFFGWTKVVVYYLPGTTGWSATYAERPTALWMLPNPVILTTAPAFGIQTNGFGFVISWATNVPVVVEASANLTNPAWSAVSTNTLTGGWFYFSDPEWTNYPARFYRLRSP